MLFNSKNTVLYKLLTLPNQPKTELECWIMEICDDPESKVTYKGLSPVMDFLKKEGYEPQPVYKVVVHSFKDARDFYTELKARVKDPKCDQDFPNIELEIYPKSDSGLDPADEFMTLGIQGGMGPDATLSHLDTLKARESDTRFLVMMLTQTPDRTASLLEPNLDDQEKIRQIFAGTNAYAKSEGAFTSVMSCNTAHSFADSMPNLSHMIEMTRRQLMNTGITKVVSFATRGTNTLALYSRPEDEITGDLTVVMPESQSDQQIKMMRIIYEEVKKKGVTEKAVQLFTELVKDYVAKEKTEGKKLAIGLFCTEFPLIVNSPLFKPEEILVKVHGKELPLSECVVFVNPMDVSGDTLALLTDPTLPDLAYMTNEQLEKQTQLVQILYPQESLTNPQE